jgi:hypothetical protein
MGLGVFTFEVPSWHSDTSYLVGLLLTSDRSFAGTSTWPYTTLTRDKTSIPQTGFEPAIPASERQQTHNLDCAATWTGTRCRHIECYCCAWSLPSTQTSICTTHSIHPSEEFEPAIPAGERPLTHFIPRGHRDWLLNYVIFLIIKYEIRITLTLNTH